MLIRTEPDPLSQALAKIDFSGRRHVLAAVSGGSDSLALLLALDALLPVHQPGVALHAATVDHRLRAGAAEEARAVAGLCAARGIPHTILSWTGSKPATGLSAAAREARYGLLAAAASAIGTDFLFTGHTRDDQAETVAMRTARGEGRGLAGMAEATLYRGKVWILRPFLGLGRASLRAYLDRAGVCWIDDPGNVDLRVERARLRADMTEADVERYAALAASEGTRRASAGESAARLIDRSASRDAAGTVSVKRDALVQAGEDAGVYALRILLASVGRREHLPDNKRAVALYTRIVSPGPFRATLGGVLINARWEVFTLRHELRREACVSQPDPEEPDGAAYDFPMPWPRFLPRFDIAPAAALARLFKIAEPPSTPVFLGHKAVPEAHVRESA